MSGIGGEEETGKLVTVQVPMPDDVDGVLEAVRSIILKGEVQNISLRVGEPIVYQRYIRHGEEIAPSESTQSFAELSPLDVVRNVRMEEFDTLEYGLPPQIDPYMQLVWMVLLVEHQGLTMTHIMMAENTDFWDWIGIPKASGNSMQRFLGARIERDNSLPSDVFLLCAAKHRSATIAEITYVFKGNATNEVENERTNQEGDRGRIGGQEHASTDGEVEVGKPPGS